jgi:hypothetical protein
VADTHTIRLLIDEASLAVSKTVNDADRATAVTLWTRVFGTTDGHELAAAVDQWAVNVGLDDKVFALPTIGQLRSIMAKTDLRSTDQPVRHVSASRSYTAAHLAFRDDVRALTESTAHRPHHAHVTPKWDNAGNKLSDGTEDCGRCKIVGENRDRIARWLAELPEPSPGSPRACRCDGSGWIDTQESKAAEYTLEWTSRAVYPCKDCNTDLFYSEEWDEYFHRPTRQPSN